MTTNSSPGSILLTGANGGLGTAIVSSILSSPQTSQHHGIYTVRNPSTAHSLNTALSTSPKTKSPHPHDILPLELNSLASVRDFANIINARVTNGTLPPIRALILNAGWEEANSSTLTPQTFTVDGYEAAFGINYLANFLLVLLLLGSMDKEHGRIVFLSSSTHDSYAKANEMLDIFPEQHKEVFVGTERLKKGVVYEDDGFRAGTRRYGASKACLVMFMYKLQTHLASSPTLSHISVLSLDPGGMLSTGMTRNTTIPLPLPARLVLKYIYPPLRNVIGYLAPNGPLRTTAKSAGDVMSACFDVDKLGVGEFPKAVYLDGSKVVLPSLECRDEVKQEALWRDSLGLVGLGEGETALNVL